MTGDNTHDHRVDRALAALGHVEPETEAANATLHRVRQALLAEVNDATPPERIRWRRFALPASAAASVLLAVMVFFVLSSRASVTAAEQFERVSERTLAYRGWVQVHDERGGSWMTDMFMASVETAVHHVNTEDGTSINDRRIAGRRTIKAIYPERRETATYDSRMNELRLGSLDPTTAAQLATAYRAWRMHLNEWVTKTKDFAADSEIAVHREDDLLRIEITFPREEAARHPNADEPVKLTIWADNETMLVQRYRRTFADGRWQGASFTYGQPVEDLYALGAPRDARIIDNRLSPRAMAQLDRLEQRRARGFGDHKAILLELAVDENWNVLSPTEAEACGQPPWKVMLMAQRGDAWAGFQYSLTSPPPERWQEATVADWVAILRDRVPDQLAVFDGQRGWRGQPQNQDFPVREIEPELLPTFEFTNWQFRTVDWCWPSPRQLGVYGYDREHQRVALLEDEEHPRRVSLEVESDVADHVGPVTIRTHRASERWQLDTARDDTPLMRLASVSTWLLGQQPEVRETRVEYLDHTRTPDGTWRPSRWRTTFSSASGSGTEWNRMTEHRLLVTPDAPSERWFANPQDRQFGNPLDRWFVR